MTQHVSSVIDQVSASMSISGLRHQVLASNVANRDVQGYQRLALAFESAMQGSLPRAHVVAEKSASNVDAEQDLIAVSANAAHYQAMARILSRYFSIIGTITGSGRG